MKFTTLCYIEKNDKYLMLYRNKKENDLNEGKWIGVGGKFEEKESPEECLLREIEEIRCEAQDDGNINWDDDHSYFCDFISKKLSEQSIFSSIEKEEITLIMSYLKECGMYAQKFNSGIIPENEVDIDKIAYTNDNLYDIIGDKIGHLQKENSKPIPYEKNNTIKR